MRNLYNAITYSPITYHGYNSCKTIVYKYDLISGKVNEVHYNPGENDEFYHRYRYDAENRLTDVYTTDNKAFIGQPGLEEHDARYQYYQHGPLARMQVGQQVLQGVDYAYTLQGWLKGINGTSQSATWDMGGDGTGANAYNASDGYTYTLYYFNGDYGAINYSKRPFAEPQAYFPSGEYRPLYNGNISSAAHNIGSRFYAQLYNYSYDQLNRLRSMDMYRGLSTSTNQWSSLTMSDLYKERYSYDANGNITRVFRNGNLSANPLMDSLTYFYKTGTNQLDYIRDKNSGSAAHSSNYGATVDIKDQASGNYVYNAIGELNYDRISAIDSIKWNVYGKMQHIYKHEATYGTAASGLHYYYDPSGNRSGMAVLYNPSTYNVYTWYVRDAQGNVMAVYKASGANLATIALKLKEHYMYGSSRLGVINRDMDVDQPRLTADNSNANLGTAYLATFTRGDKLFEFTNHLGNVLFTATDAKVPKAQTGNPSLVGSYSVNMVTAVDYTPFGMIMQGMNYGSAAPGKYRYGFNGKEWENSTKGNADQIDYGERMYDNRAGRFLSVDPLTRDYPWYSPYQFAGNKPIQFTDLDGLEENSTSTYVKIRVPVLPLMNKDKILPAPKAYYFQNDTRTPEQRQQALSDAQYKQRLNSMYNSAEGWSFRIFAGIGQSSTIVFPEAAAAKEMGQAAIEGDAQKLLQAAVTYGQSAKVRILNNTYQTLTRSNSQANRSLATLGEFNNEQALRTFNTVKSGTLPGSQGAYLGGSRLTDGQMQSLSDLYKVEFAQVYTAGTGKNGGGGFYTLYSGTRNRIDIPLSASSFLINHTHPGGTLSPSILDVNYLKKVKELGSPQRSSSIIPSGGKTFRFNENTSANGTE
jgi:RHS repeat-associated protein